MPDPTIISADHLPDPVRISVPNPTHVAAYFDRIMVFRSPDGIAFTEATGPGTRLPINAQQFVYEYVDPLSTPATTFYRVQYLNTATGAISVPSEVIQAAGDPALNVLTVAELKNNYLFGFDLTDESGNPMPDSFFEYYIKAAVSYVERRIDIPLRPQVILSELHDFVVQEYNKYIYLQLLNVPVISVQAVRLVLPTNNTVITYDPTWLFLTPYSGQLMIIPGSGSSVALALGLSTLWLPLTQGLHRFVPDVFQVDYTAGFATGHIPPELKDLVGKLASFGPLAILGDIIFGPGLAGNSISLDALMTNVKTTKDGNTGAFGGRIRRYREDIEEQFKELRRFYKGIRFTVG